MTEEKRFVTLDELCSEDVERDQTQTYLERYEAWIHHRTRVPLDTLLRAQQRFMSGKRKDITGYFVFLLRYLLLNPRIEDDRQAQLLLKADGRAMLEIIGGAVGDISDLREEVADEVGES